jgi:hypothetical protein
MFECWSSFESTYHTLAYGTNKPMHKPMQSLFSFGFELRGTLLEVGVGTVIAWNSYKNQARRRIL